MARNTKNGGARASAPRASFVLAYSYTRETKGTWVYEVKLKEGERVSGSNALYLLKSDYATRPSDVVMATFEIGGV